MRFRTPDGAAFDVPDTLLWATAPPTARASGRAFTLPGGPFEIQVVPMAHVEPPQRIGDIEHFNPRRTAAILLGMAAGDDLPPVRVAAFPGERYPFRVRDGFHRFHLSIVCGYACLPIALDPWNEPWMWRTTAA